MKVVAYTRKGKPIYEPLNHPFNKNLSTSELQSPMFDAWDKAESHAGEMKKCSAGSADHIHHEQQMKENQLLHSYIKKLWGRAKSREDKS